MDHQLENRERAHLQTTRLDPSTIKTDVLEAVSYHYHGKHLDIATFYDEFTHICPMTGLPDFGTLEIRYIPAEKIIELKSLKYYLVQYRQVGIFYEHVVHRVLTDLRQCITPKQIWIRYQTKVRGGLHSVAQTQWPEPNGDH